MRRTRPRRLRNSGKVLPGPVTRLRTPCRTCSAAFRVAEPVSALAGGIFALRGPCQRLRGAFWDFSRAPEAARLFFSPILRCDLASWALGKVAEGETGSRKAKR